MNVGMVFGIIVAIITMAAVFILGFGMLGDLLGVSEQAQINKIINDLKEASENVYNLAEGSTQKVTINVPKSVNFCFVDPKKTGANILGGWDPDSIYEDIIKDNGYTIWYEIGGGKEKNGYKINRLKPEVNFCIGSGSHTIYLENAGSTVKVLR